MVSELMCVSQGILRTSERAGGWQTSGESFAVQTLGRAVAGLTVDPGPGGGLTPCQISGFHVSTDQSSRYLQDLLHNGQENSMVIIIAYGLLQPSNL
jgi:hypothetical protein